MKHKLFKRSGFTIIEVMIVLVIAGFIAATVLIAVPSLQASRRDSQRKAYVGQVYEAMEEFNHNNGHYAGCNNSTLPLTICKQDIPRFLTEYLPDGYDPSTGVTYKTSSVTESTANGGWDFHTTNNTVYFYWFPNQRHDLTPSVGQIFIATGSACYDKHPDDSGGPVFADTPHYSNDDRDLFAIVIYQEHGSFYCLDNYDSKY